jgi:cathepsin C
MRLIFAVLLCLVMVMVQADLPMHCLREDVAGEWTFDLGPNTQGSDENCRKFTKERQMKVRLELPFTATELDSDGNTVGTKGSWTMIYDEGWEVRVNGKKYFSFCKFTQEKKERWEITSYCHQTLNGWYHDMDVSHWGCYNGTRSGKPAIHKGTGEPNYGDFSDAPMASTMQLLEEPTSALYKPETKLIETVNSRGLSWKAKAYPQWEGKTMREITRMMGFGRVKEHRTKEENIDDVDSLLEMAVSEDGAGTGTGRGKSKYNPPTSTRKAISDYPANWDWRDMNGVDYTHPAVNQGSCGSCWAVSTSDMLSMRVAIATNNTWKPRLSAQEMLVCSDKYGQGCEGGFPYLAMKYVQDYGLGVDECYPYEGRDEKCKTRDAAYTSQKAEQCTAHKRIGVSEYMYIGGGYGAATVEAMMEEVYTNGPITVCIEPSSALMYYSSGVFEEDEQLSELQLNPWQKTDHAVIVVGWGTNKKGERYWIVKNSWGEMWGDKGYFYTPLGKNSMSIENMPSAATIKLPADYPSSD